jgi:hypothetical protein
MKIPSPAARSGEKRLPQKKQCRNGVSMTMPDAQARRHVSEGLLPNRYIGNVPANSGQYEFVRSAKFAFHPPNKS